MKPNSIAAMLAAAGTIKKDIKVLLIELSSNKVIVRAVAIDAGSTQYSVQMAMRNVSEDRIRISNDATTFTVDLLVSSSRGYGRRENLTIPMSVLTSAKSMGQWLAKYSREMEGRAIGNLVHNEVRARTHNRAMARLSRDQRKRVLVAADKILLK